MAKMKKVKKDHFVVIDSNLIRDDRLSWKARGIFGYLWSMSDDWEFYEKEVMKHSSDGLASLQSGLKELERYGYLKRVKVRDKGKFKGYEWLLTDTPEIIKNEENGDIPTIQPKSENPISEKPFSEKPFSENPILSNINNKHYQIQEKSTEEKPMSESNDSLAEAFEKLWKLYPNKKGKKPAFTAYKRAIKKGTTNKQIQDGIVRYIAEIKKRRTPIDKVAHGSTFFNQERWLDDYDQQATVSDSGNKYSNLGW